LEKPGIDVNASGIHGPLFPAIREGHLRIVQELLAVPGIAVNGVNGTKDALTPLHLAAENGHLDVVRELLAKSDIAVNATWMSGYTPLHLAAKNGHREVVRALLADPRLDLTARKKDGTPLYADVLTEYSDLYHEIRKNAAYNRRSPAIVAWNRIRSRRRPAPATAPATAPAGGGRKTRRHRISRKR